MRSCPDGTVESEEETVVGDLMCKVASSGSLAVLLLLAGCRGCRPEPAGGRVSLEPDDPRPVASLRVGDADEAELLVQQLGMQVLRIEGNRVLFFEEPELMSRLEELGYDLAAHDPYDVFRRVVRIDRSIGERELRTMGVRVINREEDFLIIEATLGQLRALERGGARIAAIAGYEPRPRQIRVVVGSTEDVRRIGAMGIDIYSAAPDSRKPNEQRRDDRELEIVIHGAAFDDQIDRLEEAGYEVERLPDPAPSSEREES